LQETWLLAPLRQEAKPSLFSDAFQTTKDVRLGGRPFFHGVLVAQRGGSASARLRERTSNWRGTSAGLQEGAVPEPCPTQRSQTRGTMVGSILEQRLHSSLGIGSHLTVAVHRAMRNTDSPDRLFPPSANAQRTIAPLFAETACVYVDQEIPELFLRQASLRKFQPERVVTTVREHGRVGAFCRLPEENPVNRSTTSCVPTAAGAFRNVRWHGITKRV